MIRVHRSSLPVAIIRRAALIALLCTPAGAFAQTAEFKPPPVGTRLSWTINNEPVTGRIAGASERLVLWETANERRPFYGGWLRLFTEFSQRINTRRLEALWPLQAGKSVTTDVTYRDSSGEYMTQMTVKVEGYEPVSVPAGQFDAFVIGVSERTIGYLYSPFAREWRIWYVPSLGFMARMDFVVTSGQRMGFRSDWRLVEIAAP